MGASNKRSRVHFCCGQQKLQTFLFAVNRVGFVCFVLNSGVGLNYFWWHLAPLVRNGRGLVVIHFVEVVLPSLRLILLILNHLMVRAAVSKLLARSKGKEAFRLRNMLLFQVLSNIVEPMVVFGPNNWVFLQ